MKNYLKYGVHILNEFYKNRYYKNEKLRGLNEATTPGLLCFVFKKDI